MFFTLNAVGKFSRTRILIPEGKPANSGKSLYDALPGVFPACKAVSSHCRNVPLRTELERPCCTWPTWTEVFDSEIEELLLIEIVAITGTVVNGLATPKRVPSTRMLTKRMMRVSPAKGASYGTPRNC